MSETMNGTANEDSPKMFNYEGVSVGKVVELYNARHSEVAQALGRPGGSSYTPEVSNIIDEADELYQLGLNEHGPEQRENYIKALQTLNKVGNIN